jgi:hypothetical protein
MRRWIVAVAIVFLCSVEMNECDPTASADSPDYCAPTTCAECTTDAECDALCGVGPCEVEGEAGCWEPMRVNPDKGE